jgi:hypothetical protein
MIDQLLALVGPLGELLDGLDQSVPFRWTLREEATC